MWPVLVSLGPIAVKSFGVLLALGIFFGGFIFWQKGREEGIDEESLMDVWLISGLVGLVTARIGYVLTHWQEFGLNIYKILFVTKFPGLSSEAAWLGAVLALVTLFLVKKWPVWKLMEIAVLSLLMVEIFAWLGSFLAGANLGKPTGGWWGISFPGIEAKRQPVQLIWSIILWLEFRLLRKLEKEYRSFSWYQNAKGESQPGFLVGLYCLLLGLTKFVLGFWQDLSTWRFHLNLSQAWGLAIFFSGLLILAERSGITEKVKVKATTTRQLAFKIKKDKIKPLKRKKLGFDFK